MVTEPLGHRPWPRSYVPGPRSRADKESTILKIRLSDAFSRLASDEARQQGLARGKIGKAGHPGTVSRASPARSGAHGGAGRGAQISLWGAGRGAQVCAPVRPCQPCRQQAEPAVSLHSEQPTFRAPNSTHCGS